jgi:D-alanyl-D-alanine carboxypeptidase
MDIASAAATLVEGGCPGAVAAVRTDTLDAAAAGVADIVRAEPMTPEHRFRIGSTTKTYVAALGLLLAGEGALDLDAAGVVPGDPRITLRHLLSHRSGLANYLDGEAIAAARRADPLRGADPWRDVAEALAMPRLFEPGDGLAYCDTNYQAAGAILEDTAGSPLEELVRSRVLEPLGLTRTTFAVEGRVEDGLCSGYAFTDGWYPVPGELHEVTAHLDGAHGDGAIVSDAADVTAFFAVLLGDGILPPAALDEMTSGPESERGRTGGLGLIGWPGPDGRRWGHGGDMPGYSMELRASRDGSVVVTTLANAQGAAVSELLERVTDELCAGRI